MNRCDNCGLRSPTLHPFKDLRGRIIAWMCEPCAVCLILLGAVVEEPPVDDRRPW